MRDNFKTEEKVMRAFGVCDRTARRWLDGERAPRARHVARAGEVYHFKVLK